MGAGKEGVDALREYVDIETGTRSEYVISRLRQRIEWVAPVYCFPGEDEMEALALNALAVLRGKRKAKEYK